jgi:transcriptional regulator with XRE-family HTH domain
MTKKPFRSVAEMVDGLSEDRVFAEQARKKLEERSVIDMLMALRSVQDLSQKDIADRMGCTQSRISKLEAGKDEDLRMGDLRSYADALGLDLMMVLGRKSQGRTMVDQVKQHAFAIKQLLESMAALADKDDSIAEGVKVFFHEAAFNLAKIVQDATNTLVAANKMLPPLPEAASPRIQMERVEADFPDDATAPKRRKTANAAK